MRTPLVAGNWKMNMTRSPGLRLVEEMGRALADVRGVEVAVCPPATLLHAVGRALEGTPFLLGAQTMHWESHGAYTGEISGPMLVDLGCRLVILGHSERRLYFGETDEAVGRKVQAAFAHRLIPIVCVGERLDEREGGKTDTIISVQLRAALGRLEGTVGGSLVIAYEPVWAIGTGRTATGEEANRIAGRIRRLVGAVAGLSSADEARILYGGSVRPDNIREFVQQPEIDGALVGGASLDAQAFAAIVRAAAR